MTYPIYIFVFICDNFEYYYHNVISAKFKIQISYTNFLDFCSFYIKQHIC